MTRCKLLGAFPDFRRFSEIRCEFDQNHVRISRVKGAPL
jgi:hypothetical protein